MKLLKKVPHGNGHMYVYFMGIKLYSYKPKHFIWGQGNIVNISDTVDLNLKIFGNNNKIIIEETSYFPHLNIEIYCDDCEIRIGKGTSIGNLTFTVHEKGTKIIIGQGCMFSFDERFWPSDGHAILNDKDEVTNFGTSIVIGNHVWLGAGVTICKNTEIADGCLVGTKSVVSGKFTKPNCILAGNPARVVKENIKWDRRCPDKYIQDTKAQK